METALEAGASDFVADEGVYTVYTEPDDLIAVVEELEKAGYKPSSADKAKVPQSTVSLDNEDDVKFMSLLIEMLEDDDDVMNVYHNWDSAE